MFDMLNMLDIFKVYFENGLRKETEILVKTNFGSFIFILLLKKMLLPVILFGIVMSFHQKNQKNFFFMIVIYHAQNVTLALPLHEKTD